MRRQHAQPELRHECGPLVWDNLLGLHHQLVHLELHRYRVLAGEAAHTEPIRGAADSARQALDAQVAQRVRAHLLAYLLYVHVGGYQLFPGRHIHPEVACGDYRRSGDSQMDLTRAAPAEQLDDVRRRRTPDDAVVHDDQPLASYDARHRVELSSHPRDP